MKARWETSSSVNPTNAIPAVFSQSSERAGTAQLRRGNTVCCRSPTLNISVMQYRWMLCLFYVHVCASCHVACLRTKLWHSKRSNLFEKPFSNRGSTSIFFRSHLLGDCFLFVISMYVVALVDNQYWKKTLIWKLNFDQMKF